MTSILELLGDDLAQRFHHNHVLQNVINAIKTESEFVMKKVVGTFTTFYKKIP